MVWRDGLVKATLIALQRTRSKSQHSQWLVTILCNSSSKRILGPLLALTDTACMGQDTHITPLKKNLRKVPIDESKQACSPTTLGSVELTSETNQENTSDFRLSDSARSFHKALQTSQNPKPAILLSPKHSV